MSISVKIKRNRHFIIALLLLATLWAARYALAGSFGFYEDDYTLVVRAMAGSWAEVFAFVKTSLLDFAGQGRPLQDITLFVLSKIADDLGGIHVAYLFSFLIVGLNTILFFLLLRSHFNLPAAATGGLAYALFSADTTQAFLYHGLGLQQSLTFLLLAFHSYRKGGGWLPYLLSLLCLSSYETTFLVFVAAPLLVRDIDRKWIGQAAKHAIILSSILVAVTVLRTLAGEGRVGSLSTAEIITTPLLHMVQGPLVALGSYGLRPFQAILSLDMAIALVSLIGTLVFAGALEFAMSQEVESLNTPAPDDIKQSEMEMQASGLFSKLAETANRFRYILAGITMLVLAYPLTFTIRAFAISGRDTRVHLAAVVGAAFLIAAVSQKILASTLKLRWRRLYLGGLALVLGLHLGFGLILQRDYARAWDLQQRFWTSVVELELGLSEGTSIFFDPAGLQDTQYIGANTWNMPLVFQYIYQFPSEWGEEPSVYRLIPQWRSASLTNPIEIKAVDYRYEYVVSQWQQTIILETKKGRVEGYLDQVEVDSTIHQLISPSSLESEFPAGYLYDLLIVGASK